MATERRGYLLQQGFTCLEVLLTVDKDVLHVQMDESGYQTEGQQEGWFCSSDRSVRPLRCADVSASCCLQAGCTCETGATGLQPHVAGRSVAMRPRGRQSQLSHKDRDVPVP